MNKPGLQVSTPTDTTIVLTRIFNAPRRLVWEAMFTPDKMRRWMLPIPGWTLTACEVEARVNGILKLVWKSNEADSEMTLQGVFTEVHPHERIVHTENMVLESGQTMQLVEMHEFAEQDGLTRMRITQTYPSKEARDAALSSGMDQGMEGGYVQLDQLLTQTA